MRVYYNDSDAFVCAWLRNLIGAGLIPAGDVDERPIKQVTGTDVAGYDQCHFFAGIGGWAYALQLAGWGDRSVWTGSCPCQPFSAAGKGKAEDDPRHLWPHWFRLIRECRPERVFGEQVANGVGKGWWDVVSTDLEAEAYTVGAVVLGAHSVGAPHIRQRLWFVADATGSRRASRGAGKAGNGTDAPRLKSSRLRDAGSLADRIGTGLEKQRKQSARRECQAALGDEGANGRRSQGNHIVAGGGEAGVVAVAPREQAGTARLALQPWDAIGWLPCTDGKSRPVEPGTFPLAHGIPGRVGRLRAYGNAIVPQVAAAFVKAYMLLDQVQERANG